MVIARAFFLLLSAGLASAGESSPSAGSAAGEFAAEFSLGAEDAAPVLIPSPPRKIRVVDPAANAAVEAIEGGRALKTAPQIRCFGYPVGRTPPDDPEPPGWGGRVPSERIMKAVCGTDGEYEGYDCFDPKNAGHKCAAFCRTDTGLRVGEWRKLRVEKSIVTGDFVTESCDDVACEDPKQFCAGSWPGQDNCGSTSPRSIVGHCEGSKTDSVSWTFSAEVSVAIEAKIPFCVGGETKVSIGASRTGTESWQTSFVCDPGMQIPGCRRCPSSGGGCTYSCRVVEVEKVMNADLHVRAKVYFGAHLLHEEVCDESEGTVQIVTKEWAQPKGCVSIDETTRKCEDEDRHGQCKKTTTSSTTSTSASTSTSTSASTSASSTPFMTHHTSPTDTTGYTSTTPGFDTSMSMGTHHTYPSYGGKLFHLRRRE